MDLAQQARLIIFSQTTTTRLSKQLPRVPAPDAHYVMRKYRLHPGSQALFHASETNDKQQSAENMLTVKTKKP